VQIKTNTCCILTPPGVAALGVVRVCGSGVATFFAKRFSKTLAPSRCVHGELREASGAVIDDPVVALSFDGSFADISVHGGPWVVQATLDLLRGDGFQLVADSKDIFREAASGVECAVLQSLPLVTTELGLRCLLAQTGAWRRFGEKFELDATADLVGGKTIDGSPALLKELAKIARDRSLYWLLHAPTVAIVGPANAGKSTLANRLLGQERSIVADLPGTTRDWVGETADLDGLPVMLIDTPGIRDSDDAIEASAIAAAVGQVQSADLVILVLDGSRPLEPEQRPLIERFPDAMRVINKCDCAAAFDFASAGGLQVSATLDWGIDALIDAIHTHFGVAKVDLDRPRFL